MYFLSVNYYNCVCDKNDNNNNNVDIVIIHAFYNSFILNVLETLF